MNEQLVFRGTLSGHRGWVTQIATNATQPDLLVSASRGSWDNTLRLYDLETGKTTRRFCGHEKSVLSVAFSADNRQIVSGSRDKTARLWNTLGHCKYVFTDGGHTDWISCVRFSPNTDHPIVVTCGWDKQVKVSDTIFCNSFSQVWGLSDCSLRTTHYGHTGYLNTVTVSPDGSLCASGGKDGQAMLWDLALNKFLYTLPSGGIINALCFSPNRYWLCAAVGSSIKIWDLENKVLADDLRLELISGNSPAKRSTSSCTCLAWSADGQTLFAGYSDNLIRVWQMA
ncbi:unnamed protein product [Schistosoma mattheei]|uniref:Small ribosomal subunit protein RACK1 n=1 Tax=Schistosoma mattheei TaxID=31246 RepID=A0A183P9E4_9TREM|nr:unnamed protein product [Schistosoma mattheei]